MKGEILFEKMTDISDAFITEAALGEAYGNPRREREDSRFSRLWNSGWFVATVCAVVSLCVVAALVRWGQAGDPSEPVGPSGLPGVTDPPSASSRFEFTYELLDEEGGPLTDPVSPGSRVTVNAAVINRGIPFLYTGSSSEFSPDVRLIHEGASKTTVLHGAIVHTTDVGVFLVKKGEVGRSYCQIDIPADAPEGVYDLLLSYGNAEQVFPGILRVETEETQPPVIPEPSVPPDPAAPPTLDSATEALLCAAYAAAHPPLTADDISIDRYYGTFPSGAIVAMINDGSDVTLASWSESVGAYVIEYVDGQGILVYGDSAFHTLPEAYRHGLLSDSDLAVIHALHCGY